MLKMNMSKIMSEAHKMAREIKNKYPDVDYQFQLSLCLQYLIEEEAKNKPMNANEWVEDYYSNYKAYSYILYHNNILSKNGKFTESQEKEAKETSAFYRILPSDAEDIEQLAIQKVLEYFQRQGGYIERKHRFSLWGLCCLNASKQYYRHLARFRSYIEPKYTNIGWCGDSTIPVHNDKYNNIDFNIDSQNMFNDTQSKIISLLKAGYSKVEIADLLGISRQAVYKNLERVRKKLKEYYNTYQYI